MQSWQPDLRIACGRSTRRRSQHSIRQRCRVGLAGVGQAEAVAGHATRSILSRAGCAVFERVTAGIRPARPGAIVAELARGILREVGDSEEAAAAAQAGRTGRFRITAAPLRMQAVLAPVVQAFRAAWADVATSLGLGPIQRFGRTVHSSYAFPHARILQGAGMKVSEKSLELNVGAELLARLRGPLNMQKAYLRGLTQREEHRSGADFFARLPDSSRVFAFQFKAPRGPADGPPYTYTLSRQQHNSLRSLAVQDPGAVYYVFPFYVCTDKLVQDVPNLARDTWLLPVAGLDTPAVFGGQRTKRVRCYQGLAIASPEYPMKNLAELALSREQGIRPGRFSDWYRQLRLHASELADSPTRMNPQIARALRVMIVPPQ